MLANAQVDPLVPAGDMIHKIRTAAHVGLNRLLGPQFAGCGMLRGPKRWPDLFEKVMGNNRD